MKRFKFKFERTARADTGAMEWRWTMASRGRTVGASTEGYGSRHDCIDNCSSVTGFTFEKPDGAPHSFEYARERA